MRNTEPMGLPKLAIERQKARQHVREFDGLLLGLLRAESERISQRHVAKKLGIGAAYLHDILSGRRDISDKVWERVGATYGMGKANGARAKS